MKYYDTIWQTDSESMNLTLYKSESFPHKMGPNSCVLTDKVPLPGNFLWCYQGRRTPQLVSMGTKNICECRSIAEYFVNVIHWELSNNFIEFP